MENNNQEMNNQEVVTETVVEEVVTEEVVTEEAVAQETEQPVKDTKTEIVEKGKGIFEKAKALVQKGIELFKSDVKKYSIILGGSLVGLVAVIVALVLVIGALTNSYKTPIKTMQKYANTKTYYTSYDCSLDMLNGFCEDEMKEIVKLYKSTDEYKDNIEDEKDYFKDEIEDLKDEYGKNYKYTYKITGKEKLEKDDLKKFRDSLRDMAESLKEIEDETEDYDSEDWEEAAEYLGFDGDKSKVKKLVKIVDKIRDVYKGAKVTDGYELEVTVILTGSELDEPEEVEMTINVYKVNGRWISEDALINDWFVDGV